MKKKDIKHKLQLKKKVISSLDVETIYGGTDFTIPIDTIIRTVIKTQYRGCTIIATCNCSLHCPTTTRVETNCNTEQC
jgi:hypothetical protein